MSAFRDTFIQESYVFQTSENGYPCGKKCPYVYPEWDGTIVSVNNVLTFLGLPNISSLTKIEERRGRTYTDSNYSSGEILITIGKYCSCISAINIRKR